MKLIIIITLNILLALAFLGIYEVNNDIASPNPFIMELFISGMFILLFAFLSYVSPEARIFKEINFRKVTYFFIVVAIILFLNLFLNKYHESISFKSDKDVANLYESFTKIRINTFLNSQVFWITTIFVLILMGYLNYVCKNFSH